MQQKIIPVRRSHLGNRIRRRCAGHRQSHPRLRDIDRRQPNPQRNRRQHLKVDEALHPHPPHRLQIAMPRNSRHQRRQDQRRDDRLDQPQKDI
jgi:hypothetical protein